MAINKIVFKSEFDRKANKNFYRFSMFRRSIFMYFMFAVAVLCLILLLTSNKDKETGSSDIFLWCFCIIGILFMPLFTLMNIRTASNKDYEKRKDIFETYEITKEKISRVAGEAKVAINWNLIEKVYEVKDAYYFYTVHQEAFTITKSGLTVGTLNEFRKLINNCLTKSKKGKVPFKIIDNNSKKEFKLEMGTKK